MNLKFSKNKYNVYQVDDGYIIQNIDIKGFAHTHVNNYKTCLWLIELSINKKCPYDIPRYLIISLIKINDDSKYLTKLYEILKKKSTKKEKYYNSKKRG